MKKYSKKEIGDLIAKATISITENKNDPEFFMLVMMLGAAIGAEVDTLIDQDENAGECASKDEKSGK